MHYACHFIEAIGNMGLRETPEFVRRDFVAAARRSVLGRRHAKTNSHAFKRQMRSRCTTPRKQRD
jgi:hypothetical protein